MGEEPLEYSELSYKARIGVTRSGDGIAFTASPPPLIETYSLPLLLMIVIPTLATIAFMQSLMIFLYEPNLPSILRCSLLGLLTVSVLVAGVILLKKVHRYRRLPRGISIVGDNVVLLVPHLLNTGATLDAREVFSVKHLQNLAVTPVGASSLTKQSDLIVITRLGKTYKVFERFNHLELQHVKKLIEDFIESGKSSGQATESK